MLLAESAEMNEEYVENMRKKLNLIENGIIILGILGKYNNRKKHEQRRKKIYKVLTAKYDLTVKKPSCALSHLIIRENIFSFKN
jgi:hypothetical protein